MYKMKASEIIPICIIIACSIFSLKYRDWTRSKCQRGTNRHKGKCKQYAVIDETGNIIECTLCEKCVVQLKSEGYGIRGAVIKSVTTKRSGF